MRCRAIAGTLGVLVAIGMLGACGSSGSDEPASGVPVSGGAASWQSLPARSSLDADLAAVLDDRHSTRRFMSDPVSGGDLAALLWADYGVQSDGGRTVPSAGAIYPLAVFFLVGAVDGLEQGIYSYDPATSRVSLLKSGDHRQELQKASLDQASVGGAPLVVVVAGQPGKMRERYGNRAERYAIMESGHVAQNHGLAAAALGLGAVTVAAFDNDDVRGILGLPSSFDVYYVLPTGHAA